MAYPVKKRVAEKALIAAYVLNRKANGLAGVPAHPKNPDKIGGRRIARETGVPYLTVRKLCPYLEELAKNYGLENPIDAAHAAAAERIRVTYRDRPVPQYKNSFSKAQVSFDVGVSIMVVESKVCRDALAEAIAKNGLAKVTADGVAEAAALSGYGDFLVRTGRKVPWRAGLNCVDVMAIATETGLSPHRLRFQPLATLLQKLVDEIGHEAVLDFAAETAALAAHIDEAILNGSPPPSGGSNGVNIAEISRRTGIAVHRLHTHAPMKAQVDRWALAVPPAPAEPVS